MVDKTAGATPELAVDAPAPAPLVVEPDEMPFPPGTSVDDMVHEAHAEDDDPESNVGKEVAEDA